MGNGVLRSTACRYCGSTDVARLYVAASGLDACACNACGARWDEDAVTGEFRARQARVTTGDPRA